MLTELELNEPLIWYDFPLLSHVREHGVDYLVLWIDETEERVWIYLAAQTDLETIECYKEKKIPLREVLECSPSMFMGPLGDFKPITWDELSEELRPTPDSYLPDV